MVAAGLTLAGLVFIGLAFLKRKKVGAAYDEMYAAYPELRGNLDLLKRYGITTNIESFLIFLSDDRSYKGKKKKIEIKNVGEETDDFLQPFFRAVAQEFPNTAVGYENNRPF